MIRFKVTVKKKLNKDFFAAVVEEQVKAVCKQIFEGVVKRSPVKSGSYRASWTLQFDKPNLDVVSGPLTGTLPPPTFEWPPGFQLGTHVFIANGQPYAQRIENGWSKQAPAGVVRVTLAELRLL